MQAIRLHGPHDLRCDEIPEPPPPEAGEVTIAISAVGVCGSDIHMYETGGIGGRFVDEPVALGHEFAGTVTAVGESARTEDGLPLEVGSRVTVDPSIPCGHCEPCRNGHPNLCPDHIFFGVPPDPGSLCERMNVPSRNCYPVPDMMSDAAAAMLEPLGVALHAVDLGKINQGDAVVVFGAGPIGLLLVVLCRIAGASAVHVFEPMAARRAHAESLGAIGWNVATEATTAAVVQPFLDATDGRGADVGFEAADAGGSVDQTFTATRIGGRVVLVGIPAHDRTDFGHAMPRRKGLTVRFARRMKHTYPRVLELIEHPLMRGVLDGLVSHRFSLAETKAAFDLAESLADGVVKAVVEPTRWSGAG